MPASVSSSRPEKRSDSPDSRTGTLSPYVPYRSSSAAAYSPFNHGSPHVWSAASRRVNLTCTLSRVTWTIGVFIFILLFMGIWNAGHNPFVSLFIPQNQRSCQCLTIFLHSSLPATTPANPLTFITTCPISPTSHFNLLSQLNTAFQMSSTHSLATSTATPATSLHLSFIKLSLHSVALDKK